MFETIVINYIIRTSITTSFIIHASFITMSMIPRTII